VMGRNSFLRRQEEQRSLLASSAPVAAVPRGCAKSSDDSSLRLDLGRQLAPRDLGLACGELGTSAGIGPGAAAGDLAAAGRRESSTACCSLSLGSGQGTRRGERSCEIMRIRHRHRRGPNRTCTHCPKSLRVFCIALNRRSWGHCYDLTTLEPSRGSPFWRRELG
jgi:hypothetical protein